MATMLLCADDSDRNHFERDASFQCPLAISSQILQAYFLCLARGQEDLAEQFIALLGMFDYSHKRN